METNEKLDFEGSMAKKEKIVALLEEKLASW